MLKNFLTKYLVSPIEKQKTDIDGYIQNIESGVWQNKFVYGISEYERGFLTVNPVENPGALYFGGMGSGKSQGMKFSLITRMATNSENDLYILVDTLKGMTDYKIMFKYRENVVTALNDPAKVIPVIDMIYAECMARKDAFSKVGANNIYSFESEMRKKDPNYRLARIIVCFEEFHSIPNSEYIKYSYKSDTPGSAAYQLKELFRISRSYGFHFALASQRCTPDDTPSSIKPGLTTILGFRVNNPGDAAAANLPAAADIPSSLRGRCVYENGQMQFPYMTDETADVLLKKFYRPLKAKLLKYSVEDYHTALGGEGNEGMVRVKPYKDILTNISQYNPMDVYTRFLESFGFKVDKQTNTALAVQLIAERNSEKFAVLATTNRDQLNDKYIDAFKNGANILKCENAILLSADGSLGGALAKLSSFKNKLTADKEDLMRAAEVLDNRIRLEEEGSFDFLFEKLSLAIKKTPVEDEIDSEEDDDDMPDFESLKAKIRASMNDE